MDVSKMKNIVVFKNLPSNIVDEAFVVLKENKKVKNLENAKNIKNTHKNEEGNKNSEYMLKEAEMLVTDYISKIENQKKLNNKSNNKKPNKIKIWAYISTVIALVEGIMLFAV